MAFKSKGVLGVPSGGAYGSVAEAPTMNYQDVCEFWGFSILFYFTFSPGQFLIFFNFFFFLLIFIALFPLVALCYERISSTRCVYARHNLSHSN